MTKPISHAKLSGDVNLRCRVGCTQQTSWESIVLFLMLQLILSPRPMVWKSIVSHAAITQIMYYLNSSVRLQSSILIIVKFISALRIARPHICGGCQSAVPLLLLSALFLAQHMLSFPRLFCEWMLSTSESLERVRNFFAPSNAFLELPLDGMTFHCKSQRLEAVRMVAFLPCSSLVIKWVHNVL